MAHVRGDHWLCYCGGSHCGFDLSVEALVERDVSQSSAAALPAIGPKRRRLRRKVVVAGDERGGAKHFQELAALGAWKAEQLRAAHELRDVDPDTCSQIFDPCPSELPHGTHSRVAFLWRWLPKPSGEDDDPKWQQHITFASMNHLLHDRRLVPFPPAFEAPRLRQLMANAACHKLSVEDDSKRDFRKPSVACKFLGVCKLDRPWAAEAKDFEQDPAKFDAGSLRDNGWMSQAAVWYEWEHVQRETSEGLLPHRVTVRADAAIQRGVPQDPLGDVAPRGLHFSVDFMKKAAEAKDPRIKYRGIALDGESVEFIEDVPGGGRDIQDAPVYWTLPGGRTVHKSVRDLVRMQQEELKEGLGPEVYAAIAKELNYWCLGYMEDLARCPGVTVQRRYTAALPDTSLEALIN